MVVVCRLPITTPHAKLESAPIISRKPDYGLGTSGYPFLMPHGSRLQLSLVCPMKTFHKAFPDSLTSEFSPLGLIEVEFAIKGEIPYDIRNSVISIVDERLEFLTAAELGSVIKQKRKAFGLTQTDLASKLNVSVSIVSYWER